MWVSDSKTRCKLSFSPKFKFKVGARLWWLAYGCWLYFKISNLLRTFWACSTTRTTWRMRYLDSQSNFSFCDSKIGTLMAHLLLVALVQRLLKPNTNITCCVYWHPHLLDTRGSFGILSTAGTTCIGCNKDQHGVNRHATQSDFPVQIRTVRLAGNVCSAATENYNNFHSSAAKIHIQDKETCAHQDFPQDTPEIHLKLWQVFHSAVIRYRRDEDQDRSLRSRGSPRRCHRWLYCSEVSRLH